MTKKEKDMLNVKIGQRLKFLIKEYDAKHEVTAKYLHCTTTTISRYCTGTCPVPRDVIKKLALRWDVREEYIKCLDDYKTDSELFDILELQNKAEFICQKKYLETLGFKMVLTYRLDFFPMTSVYRHKEALLPLLREDSLNSITSNEDFELPYKEFAVKYVHKSAFLYLNKPLTKELENSIGSIHKHSQVKGSSGFWIDHFDLDSSKSPFGENTSMRVAFEVTYNEKPLGDFGIADIQNLFKTIDSYAKCTIETMLIKE